MSIGPSHGLLRVLSPMLFPLLAILRCFTLFSAGASLPRATADRRGIGRWEVSWPSAKCQVAVLPPPPPPCPFPTALSPFRAGLALSSRSYLPFSSETARLLSLCFVPDLPLYNPGCMRNPRESIGNSAAMRCFLTAMAIIFLPKSSFEEFNPAKTPSERRARTIKRTAGDIRVCVLKWWEISDARRCLRTREAHRGSVIGTAPWGCQPPIGWQRRDAVVTAVHMTAITLHRHNFDCKIPRGIQRQPKPRQKSITRRCCLVRGFLLTLSATLHRRFISLVTYPYLVRRFGLRKCEARFHEAAYCTSEVTSIKRIRQVYQRSLTSTTLAKIKILIHHELPN